MPKKSRKPELWVRREFDGEGDLEELIAAAYSAYFSDMINLNSSGDTFASRDNEPYNGVNKSKEDNGDGSAA